jgi:hypothetical protein
MEGENPHPSNYRGCRHAKNEMQKKKVQRKPKATTGRLITSKLISPGMTFAAALQGKAEEQQQPKTHQMAGPATMETRSLWPYPNKNSRKEASHFGLQM